MPELFQDRKIGNQIADGDSGARFASFWLKNTERQVLQWKMRIRCDLDECF